MTIDFDYTAPSETGTYIIPGFEISYQLATSDLTKFSPGIISRIYGPIELKVEDSVELWIPEFSIDNQVSNPIGASGFAKMKSTVSGIELTRSYSQKDNIKSGDLVVVTLTIKNNNDTMNFIMVEDTIPIGFTIEPSTIPQSAEMYEITSTGVTFFFPELLNGETQISYGLVASNIRQSLASPAKLSSMYDEWMVKSSSTILGEVRVPIDPLTGEVNKDLSFPELLSMKFDSAISSSDSAYLRILVDAQDNWGIASIRVFVAQENWHSFNCFSENDKWVSKAVGLQDGKAVAYVEIIDFAGNVFVSKESTHNLKLDDLIIPVLPMIILIVMASVIGLSVSFYVRKRGI
jgi:hypothetical protein